MENLQGFEMVPISDSDEPEETIVQGMARSDFDSVLLALVPNGGGVGETSWYGTPDTADGRPIRPVLLFHRGHADAKGDGIEHLSAVLGVPAKCVVIVAEWERISSQPTAQDNWRTLEVHTTYPPYPWLDR